MSLTGRPSSPPLALISSSQIFMPSSACLPLGESGPVSAIANPILIGSPACPAAPFDNGAAAATASSPKPTRLSMCLPPWWLTRRTILCAIVAGAPGAFLLPLIAHSSHRSAHPRTVQRPAIPRLGREPAFFLDEAGDLGDALAGAQGGHDERPRSPHAPGIARHDFQRGADIGGKIDLVDDEQVRARDARPSFRGDLVARRHVDHVDGEVGELGRES